MKFRFDGDKLQLVRYTIIVPADEMQSDTEYTAVTDAERDGLIEMFPTAEATEVDNSGYEWLDGTIWTQEQIAAGEVEKAIALGEANWKALRDANDQRKINAMLMLEIAKLKAGVKNE